MKLKIMATGAAPLIAAIMIGDIPLETDEVHIRAKAKQVAVLAACLPLAGANAAIPEAIITGWMARP